MARTSANKRCPEDMVLGYVEDVEIIIVECIEETCYGVLVMEYSTVILGCVTVFTNTT
jgi:hypothetical protein